MMAQEADFLRTVCAKQDSPVALRRQSSELRAAKAAGICMVAH